LTKKFFVLVLSGTGAHGVISWNETDYI